jgi:hypothetical protein
MRERLFRMLRSRVEKPFGISGSERKSLMVWRIQNPSRTVWLILVLTALVGSLASFVYALKAFKRASRNRSCHRVGVRFMLSL